jgi:hypothetical protein
VKNSAIFLASLAQMAMATSLASANPTQHDSRRHGDRPAPAAILLDRAAFASHCNGLACPSTEPTQPSTEPPAAGWTMRMFVRRDCLEPAEGSAHFDDLAAHRSPSHMRGELLLGEDCGDDAED